MNKEKIILLAEDDDYDSELTMEALKEYSVCNGVTRVCNGEELLDFLKCEGAYTERDGSLPVVILLDLKMPKIGGLEVLKIIKNDEKFRDIPVVVLTSSHEDSDLQECYKYKVNAYVVKPVDFHQLIEAVKGIGCFWSIYNELPY
ncbi:MAG: response regulator [Legionellaceae bacterium]|nr:response regulator [Legionellaceae bacterium]